MRLARFARRRPPDHRARTDERSGPAHPRAAASGCARLWIALAWGAAAACAGPAAATGDEKELAERLALARARGAMWEQVCKLPIDARSTVGHWVTGSLPRERALRLMVRNLPAWGPARHYSDGTVEVDVRLSPRELHSRLTEISRLAAADHSAGDAARPDLAGAAGSWGVLWATGSASVDEPGPGDRPPGWEEVSAEGLELARRAAVDDAIQALVEEVGGLKVTAARRLREFLASGSPMREAMVEGLTRVARVTVELHPDQVAVARATIDRARLIELLIDAHRRHHRGDLLREADFREMALLTEARELTATGLATVPRRWRMPTAAEWIDLTAPGWAGWTLRATGCSPGAPADEPGSAGAADQARREALEHLLHTVENLAVDPEQTVGNLLDRHPHLRGDVALFVSGARTAAPDASPVDGPTQVSLELPLARLWHIVARGLDPDHPGAGLPGVENRSRAGSGGGGRTPGASSAAAELTQRGPSAGKDRP